jgi:hypothetical protein
MDLCGMTSLAGYFVFEKTKSRQNFLLESCLVILYAHYALFHGLALPWYGSWADFRH